jgi:hypothetical protein
MRNKHRLVWLGASVLLLGVACGEGETSAKELAKSAQGAAESLDLSKLTPDAMKEKAGELMKTITTQLDEIKDRASATSAASVIGPLAEQLTQLKSTLGANLPDMGALRTAVEGLAKKFALDQDVMGVLKPLMEKLQGLLK